MPHAYSDADDAPWELLARHLAGELTDAGQAELRQWLRHDARHQQILTTVTRAWERAGEASPAPPLFTARDVEAAWQRFRPLMAAAAPTAPQLGPGPAETAAAPQLRVAATRRRATGRALWRVAALLLVLGGVAYAFSWQNRGRPAETAVRYASGERPRFVQLPDGSRAWLNARSELRYAGRADAGPRAVQLTGEAYFEVQPLGAARPFSVASAAARVRVVGTAFNVRAYAAEDSVEVSVTHGRVWLGRAAAAAGAADSVLLTAGTRAALRAADAPGSAAPAAPRPQPVPDGNFRAWQTDTLRFADAPVGRVLRALQAAYGTRVAVQGAGLAQCRFTGTFPHPQPAQVLAVLAAATGSRLVPDPATGGFVLAGAGCAPPAENPGE